MAQLAERSLPTSKAHGLNPVIGKIYILQLFTVNCINTPKTEKESGNGPFQNIFMVSTSLFWSTMIGCFNFPANQNSQNATIFLCRIGSRSRSYVRNADFYAF